MLSPLGWHTGAVTNARRRGLHVEKQLLALFSSDVQTLGRRLWHYSPCLNVWRMVFLSQLQTGTGKNLISSAAKMDVREKKEKKKKNRWRKWEEEKVQEGKIQIKWKKFWHINPHGQLSEVTFH